MIYATKSFMTIVVMSVRPVSNSGWGKSNKSARIDRSS
jgi:hypothetical protein